MQDIEQKQISDGQTADSKPTKKTVRSLVALLMAAIIIAGSIQTVFFTAFAAEPPAVPKNVKAESSSYSSIKISWSPVQSASGYVVYRYSFIKKAYERLTVTKKTSYTNTGLTTAKSYYYKARAYTTVNGKNIYGAPSKAVSVKPVPSVPSNFKAVSQTYSSTKLSWEKVAGASGYVVYRYNSVKKAYERHKVTKITGFTNTGLSTGKTYYYKVRAYRTTNGKNVYGNPSGAVKAIPIPAVPYSVKAAGASRTSIVIVWSAVNGASGYVVYRSNSADKDFIRITVSKAKSFTDTSLTAGKIYYYKVRAYRTAGGANVYGNPSAAVSAKPSTPATTTTVPATTVPATTVPSTTKPSTTAPATTNPSTTKPSTTSPATYKGGELSKILQTDKYTIKYYTQVETDGKVETIPIATHISGKKIAFDTSMAYEGAVLNLRMLSTGTEYFAIVEMEDVVCYGKLNATQFNSVYTELDLVNGYDANAAYLGTENVTYQGVNYICESYSKDGVKTEYFYKDKKLRRIEITYKDGTTAALENVVFTASVDESVFTSPKDLGYINASLLISSLF